jgi:hypothetical protein
VGDRVTNQTLAVELGAARDRIKEQGIENANLRNQLAALGREVARLQAANDLLVAAHESNIRLLSNMLQVEHAR